MATIFFTCLQCGEYLRANHYTIAHEVSLHMCQNTFNSVQFQKGVDLLQKEAKLKSVSSSSSTPQPIPSPPPPPPTLMPPTLSVKHKAKKQPVAISHCNKGKKTFDFRRYLRQLFLALNFVYPECKEIH